MTRSDKETLKQLLDYHFQLDVPQDHKEIEKLLAKDTSVQKLNQSVENILKPLDEWSEASAPAGLAGRTMQLIDQHQQAQKMAQASAKIAAQKPLLISGSRYDTQSRFSWIMGNLRDLIAVAACLALFFMVSQPGLKHARQASFQQRCAYNLKQIYQGMEKYAQDYNGLMPSFGQNQSESWMKQNTKNVYLLVKLDYVPVDVFICPGSTCKRKIRLTPEKLKELNDFIGREHVSYSFRPLFGSNRLENGNPDKTLLMSDKNPLFAGFDFSIQDVLDISQNPKLKQANSPNHNERGQCLLFHDGSMDFSESRFIGIKLDDIYMIEDTTRYNGSEIPQSDDIFNGP